MREHVKQHFHGDQMYGRLSKAGVGRFKGLVPTTTFISIFFFFFVLVAASLNWMDLGYPLRGMIFPASRKHQERIEYPLNCTAPSAGARKKCRDYYPTVFEPDEGSSSRSSETCPDYFRWIHHDLQQWKHSGVTEEMIERGKETADFRMVIIKGVAYLERYKRPYQTRDVFTVWGILQLLRLYPGKIPDLDLLFYSGDKTRIMKKDYQGPNATSSPPPPLFHYCGEEEALDIVFPDWTFWGWAEVNIMPWEWMLKSIKKGRKKVKWEDRVPYAYWKGNPYVSHDRVSFLKCNVSDKYDWNVRLYSQNWRNASKEGFKNSKLEDQCSHRYKIYIEGATWSVSKKYILACDSMMLMIEPKYFDFYSRSLVPMQHYWPIRANNKCRDLKFAVEWGNNHTTKAKAIGKAGSKLVEELLKMQNVYDYMFHVLNEYAKLLKFKPTKPPKARRICAESMACSREGLWKKFMEQSLVKSPSNTLPCSLPPPYKPQDIEASLDARRNITRQVEMWEAEYWKKLKQ